MLDTKTICTLIGLGAIITAINFMKKDDIQENWGALQFTTIPDSVASIDNPKASDAKFFSIPGQYQSLMAPRFSNTDYGANIKYNMPSRAYQAVPLNPIGYAKMAAPVVNQPTFTKEGYGCGPCGSKSNSCGGPTNCNKGGISESYKDNEYSLPASYAAGNYNAALQKASMEGQQTNNLLPLGTMRMFNSDLNINGGNTDDNGTIEQPIVYDRPIFANINSRLRSQGDMIRGDLPIVPVNNGWFTPAVNPSNDLQQGALAVIGGLDAQQAQAMANLMLASSAGTTNTVSGVNLQNLNLGNSFNAGLSAGLNDIQVTTFN